MPRPFAPAAAAPNIDPPTFAAAARLCVEELASACDALAASTEDPRWRDVATQLDIAGLTLREVERLPL
jgi:hypothetical protein